MPSFWRDLPTYLDPVAFSIGSFKIYWYGIMYLVGFVIVWALLELRIRKREAGSLSFSKDKDWLFNLLLVIFLGIIIGGKLGYLVFYNLKDFLADPSLNSFLGIGLGGGFSISGMSYHGGLIGAVAAGYIYSKFKKTSFWAISDFVIPAIPAGYFFGRLGNFINGELYGRATGVPWAMDFGDGILRHPSQLYEALFEGLFLFAILWSLRNVKSFPGFISLFYIGSYGIIRFMIEFWREPDPQIGLFLGWLTLGQILSFGMVLFVVVALYKAKYLKLGITTFQK